MFDKKELPTLSVKNVISAIKKSYVADGGYASKITQKYIDDMVTHEKCYISSNKNFYNISSTTKVDQVTNKIAIYFYNDKIVNKKIGRIYNSLLQYNNSTCPICGSHADTLDHVLPKADYTQYTITPINLVPLCSRCNRKKGSIVSGGKIGEVIFHPYFNDYHEMDGLAIAYRINRKKRFVPYYYFEPFANKECIYNFDVVFKLNEVLSALAIDEITKISRVILTKKTIAKELKSKAQKLINQRKNGLIGDLDEPWKILLYELLVDNFDVFYEYEIIRK